MSAPALVGSRNDIADGGDTQPFTTYQDRTVEDAEMGQESAALLDHPGVLGTVARVFEVERLEVAAGPLVVGEQVQDRFHVLRPSPADNCGLFTHTHRRAPSFSA